MTELKPCAHCGGSAEGKWRYRRPGGNACYWVRCIECGVSTTAYDTEAEAIEAWNRRTNDGD